MVNPIRCRAIAVVLLALAGGVAPAVAQPAPGHGVRSWFANPKTYGTVAAGGVFFNDVGKRSTGSFTFNPGYMVAVALGYDFGKLRTEVEGHYISADISRFRLGGATLPSSGSFQSGGGFLNFYYDIENPTPITPYLGAGAGVEYVEIDDVIVGGVGLGGRRGAVFGWQAGGGFTYPISRELGLGVGYRYTVFEGEVGTEAHRIMVSLRRYF